jgi:hypothetical protein
MRLAFKSLGEEAGKLISRVKKLRIEMGMHDSEFYTVYER